MVCRKQNDDADHAAEHTQRNAVRILVVSDSHLLHKGVKHFEFIDCHGILENIKLLKSCRQHAGNLK